MEKKAQNAQDLAQAFAQGQASAVDLLTPYCDAIEKLGEDNPVFIAFDRAYALDQAKALDEAKAQGKDLGPLAGVPVAIKDNISTAHYPTTCASAMLLDYHPPFEATVIDRLREAGAIILGKTNMDEFAMGNTNETSYFGCPQNPYDPAKVPGGSSGGSAVAVAMDLAPLALGSDTGGSIREPAAYCGVYGLKPTYGAVSRYGCVAFASSLDQIGPMAKTPADLALIMDVIAGQDDKDATSSPDRPTSYGAKLGQSIAGLKVGVPDAYLGDSMAPSVQASMQAYIDRLKAQGVEVETIHMPSLDYILSAYYVISTAEASSNLGRFDGVRYGLREEGEDVVDMFRKTRSSGFGEEVKRRIMFGTYVLSAGYYDAYYNKALQVRTLLIEDVMKAFKTYDALLTPTTVDTAPKIGETIDAVTAYSQDICTVGANLSGCPALSFPYGTDDDGMPIGLQLIAPPLGEDLLLQIADQTPYEEARS